MTPRQVSRSVATSLVRPNSTRDARSGDPDNSPWLRRRRPPTADQKPPSCGDPSNIFNHKPFLQHTARLVSTPFAHTGKTGALCDVLEAKETETLLKTGYRPAQAVHTLQPGDTVLRQSGLLPDRCECP